MTDKDLRGIILAKFYELRRKGPFQWAEFSNNPEIQPFFEQVGKDLIRICGQLSQHGLIDWEGLTAGGRLVGGVGMIAADGVDVIEGNKVPPIAITVIDRTTSVSVNNSQNVIVGNGNTQTLTAEVAKIITAIDHSTASEAEKKEAKSRLEKFLEHPLVATLVGSIAS
ncbi:MAG: hypothetical protein EBS05_22530 [Proteobacteria bacterium]|nr:hypothetical protein [Pseudomonadota bacterium]